MTDLSVQHLLDIANQGRLAVSGVRYYLNDVQVDADLGWVAADMVADGLLFIPDVARSAKQKTVRPTVRGLAVLDGTEAPR